jgi:hypothetical protein
MLDEKMGKVAKGERKREREREREKWKKKRKEKCFIVFVVLKFLCWWSLKSKEVK